MRIGDIESSDGTRRIGLHSRLDGCGVRQLMASGGEILSPHPIGYRRSAAGTRQILVDVLAMYDGAGWDLRLSPQAEALVGTLVDHVPGHGYLPKS